MNTQTRPRVAVVGGSLVGPATEVMLREAGIPVTTLEASRVAHPQSGGVMGLRPATLELLRRARLDVAGLVALESHAVSAYDLGEDRRPARRRYAVEFPGETTGWDQLHRQLARRTDVHHAARVTGVTPEGVALENGAHVDADLVVFADGRKSRGRELLAPDRALEYQGYLVWRGLTEPPRHHRPVGFERYYADDFGVLFSITAPLVDGRTYWEFQHNLDVGTYHRITGHVPTERAFVLPRHVTPDARRVLAAFASAHLPDEFRDLVVGTAEVMMIPVNDLPAPRRAAYRVGRTRAVLLSDALAPVRLQSGMGLNGGLQQASDLVDRLRRASADPADLDHALRTWESGTITKLLPWIELGRVRSAATHLGTYAPVLAGATVPPFVPGGSPFDPPTWIEATS